MNITCSIVLYNNNKADFELAISSFLRFIGGIIYVIDNSEIPLESIYFKNPRVKYIYTNKNLGFGSAHNLCINNNLESKYHVVINPDVYFTSDVIETLVKILDKDNSIAAIMPLVKNNKGHKQYLCKLLPTPFDLFFRRFFQNSLICKLKNSIYEMHQIPMDSLTDVPVISGCFFIARTKVIADIKGFDERFFMYMEDVDIFRRISMCHRVVFFPGVEITHLHEKGSFKSKRLLLLHIISAIKYFNKWGWFYDPYRSKINDKFIIKNK